MHLKIDLGIWAQERDRNKQRNIKKQRKKGTMKERKKQRKNEISKEKKKTKKEKAKKKKQRKQQSQKKEGRGRNVERRRGRTGLMCHLQANWRTGWPVVWTGLHPDESPHPLTLTSSCAIAARLCYLSFRGEQILWAMFQFCLKMKVKYWHKRVLGLFGHASSKTSRCSSTRRRSV